MPLYEYECASCQKVHEVMQKFSDAPLAECPECHGPVAKIMSMSSFALKGSGWYTTDYKRKSAPVASTLSTAAPAAANAPGSSSTPSVAAAPAPASTVK